MSQPQQQSDNKTQQPIYLFVSKNCQHCTPLINEIQKKPELAKRVQAVGVENVKTLPPALTRVPGLLVEGKVIMGNDCFKWVAEYGEIGESPTFSSRSGYQADSFSFIGETEDKKGTNEYSFIGQSDGNSGINTKVVDMAHQKEQEKRNGSDSIMKSMEALESQRRSEVVNTAANQQTGGPNTQIVY